MRYPTLTFLAAALFSGAVALWGRWEHVESVATVIYFVCMNLVAISLVAGPYRRAAEPAGGLEAAQLAVCNPQDAGPGAMQLPSGGRWASLLD